ncbi:protein-disulfide reductase DsbD domain-containing protein [Paracoccus sp. (in: a-proteobacteria)]|uniref:protein-disulfide reductase DsbD domain-containing protein n=1 Tax=Paracoccus sp. TaxID=267 RepID=UPI0028B10F5C|nr:protein-disulfide reductase DsbD domain-containing protein [Paracoccus sp. (in: a-proteobacteria)]
MKTLALLFMTAAPALAQDLPPGLLSATLLPGWTTSEGHRMTALHLRLEPGWKTYWRSPGDAGVPPRFDWAGSQNLGEVRLLWPRPEVIESGGERTLGYHEELVLPIEITPVISIAPVDAKVVVDFGICQDICVPVRVELQAEPAGSMPDPLIEAAIARQPESSDLQPDCHIAPIADGMQVTATLPAAESDRGDEVAMELADDEIWVSAPETQEAGGKLTAQADFVAASGKPFALDPASLRLTLIGPDDAVEFQGCRVAAN